MLLSLLFFIAAFLSSIFRPLELLKRQSAALHEACEHFVPNSKYRIESLSLICGDPLKGPTPELQNSGLIHCLLIYGFQIYLVHKISKYLFTNQKLRNFFDFGFILFILMVTRFHPSSLRAAVILFLKELSYQKKFFWSSLQVAVFGGFACLALEASLTQSRSFLIGWTAAITFGFFSKHGFFIKIFLVPIFLLPLVAELGVPHPIINFIFSFFSRPLVSLLLPVSLLGCINLHFLKFSELIFDGLFGAASFAAEIFWPIYLGFSFSLIETWLYLVILMSVFLYLENRSLRGA